MLMIRFQRTGRTNDPAFRVVLLEKARAAKTGCIVEQLGAYNPKSKVLALDGERIKEWIAKGAQPTDSIKNLLITKGILSGKKVNVLPKKAPIKKEKIACEVFIGGSFARGTLIKQRGYDVDIFVRFDWQYEKLSEDLERIINNLN